MATDFNGDFAFAKKHAPNELKPSIAEMEASLPKGKTGVYFDKMWNKSKSRQWQAKANEDEYQSLALLFGVNASGKAFNANVAGYKIQFKVSRKKSATAADAKSTRMQELGSAWILRRALKDNHKYGDWTDIRKDPKFGELQAIYPDVSDEWLKGYWAQAAKMQQVYASPKFDEFNREGGFMGYITQLINDKFGIKQKDNWNPADIWMIQNERQVVKIIEETVDGNGSQTIMELNAVLRQLFKEEKVIGVSLKKISGKVAHWETYNVEDMGLKDTYNYSTTDMKCTLVPNNKGEITQDSIVKIEGNGTEYKFQIKANDSSNISNLKFEPTQKGMGAARIGKAPVAMVAALLKDAKVDFTNDWKNFPKDAKEFNDKMADYKRMLAKLQQKNVDLGTSNLDEAVGNLAALFLSKPHVANSKCMQISFLHVIVNMQTKKRDEFMTDMVFLASKKGKRFGPFGKLY